LKLAIISSYSESCGNAAFTRVLHDSIERYAPDFEVEVVELNLRLLQSIDGAVRKKGDAHIGEICKTLANFDMVNVQMEAGLYGTFPSDIVGRFKRILGANKNTSVTLHSPRLIGTDQSNSRRGIKKLLKLDILGGLRDLIGDRYANVHVNINKKIVLASIQSNARLIVHTTRAQKQISDFFGYDNVVVHPLKIVADDFSPRESVLKDIAAQSNFDSEDVLVGMFGYISAYKGHTDALKALSVLPKNYKLLIFGRQHPQTLKANGSVDEYINSLVYQATTQKRLRGRVFFMGELDDQSFQDVASGVDIAWLPYYENGQDGSGIASICVDLCPRVLCSTSFAFDELFKLIKYRNVRRFDIGNYLEMASKTKMLLSETAPVRPFADQSKFNVHTQAMVYARRTV
jgi:glycosyltransferase involved in cell wall biosynthesis